MHEAHGCKRAPAFASVKARPLQGRPQGGGAERRP